MKDLTAVTIEGESIVALFEVLRRFERVDPADDDGMVHLEAEYPSEIGDPFHRALMRVEAELLLDDANALGSEEGYEERTDGQRRHDAFIELVRRMGDAAAAA
jgi:hypothetical protein